MVANGKAQFLLQHNTETHVSMEEMHQYVKGLKNKIMINEWKKSDTFNTVMICSSFNF